MRVRRRGTHVLTNQKRRACGAVRNWEGGGKKSTYLTCRLARTQENSEENSTTNRKRGKEREIGCNEAWVRQATGSEREYVGMQSANQKIKVLAPQGGKRTRRPAYQQKLKQNPIGRGSGCVVT